jgi:hypothetical protein
MSPIVLGVLTSVSIPDIGLTWLFQGDSHTDGRATGDCRSPGRAFAAIWDQTYATPTVTHDGVSGCSLSATRGRYNARSTGAKSAYTMVVTQESGNQAADSPTQDTAAHFGDTFDDAMADIIASSASAIRVYETAFSFGREAESGRNWTDWNTELRSHIATLNAAGNHVYLAETDAIIKALQDGPDFVPSDLWFQAGEANEYHFTATGNFAIALGLFKALGYDVTALDTSNITQVSSGNRALIAAAVDAI